MSNRHETKALPYDWQLSEERIEALERRIMMTIKKKRRQVNRMRWAVGTAWGLLLVLIIIGGFFELTRGNSILTSTMAVVAQATFVIALFLTVSWYVRSVSLRFDSVQQALAAIYDQIADESVDVTEENTPQAGD